MIRIYIFLLIIGISSIIGINKYFEKNFEHKVHIQGEQSLQRVDAIYHAVISTYLVAAKKDFIALLKNTEAMELLKSFKYAQSVEQNKIRGALYRLLYKDYEIMKTFHVRQFHLHTDKGESLLRFHIPYESGDSLLNLRTSIFKANTKLQTVSGFEGGRIYPGYRYVFPIIFENDHLGSVEFSISFEGIETELKRLLPDNIFQLIMTKESTIDRVFKWHQLYFSQSKWDENYYLETSVLSSVNKNNHKHTLFSIMQSSPEIKKLIGEKKSFSSFVIKNNNGYFINFIAFKNIDNIHAGYIVCLCGNNHIVKLQNEMKFHRIIAILSLIIILVLILFLIKEASKLSDYRIKLERLIDLQKAIVILTNGKDFTFANQSFYNFFGYDNLESFQKIHSCICERFIVNKDFFSLDTLQKYEQDWIVGLLNLPERKRIVSILDKNNVSHAFSVGINIFDKNTYVVNFSDVSDAMMEKLQFEDQATHDPLTGAYNRAYLDNSIDTIKSLYDDKNLLIGVIFLDIDYFKRINDSFGHEVGDKILQELVRLIKVHLRKNDYLIRWGGEEFIVLVGVDSLESSLYVAENLRKKIESHLFTSVEKLTCSFGVAIGNNSMQIDKIISNADKKLYEAKEAGRNLVCS